MLTSSFGPDLSSIPVLFSLLGGSSSSSSFPLSDLPRPVLPEIHTTRWLFLVQSNTWHSLEQYSAEQLPHLYFASSCLQLRHLCKCFFLLYPVIASNLLIISLTFIVLQLLFILILILFIPFF